MAKETEEEKQERLGKTWRDRVKDLKERDKEWDKGKKDEGNKK